MSTVTMTECIREVSPRFKARLAGVLYVVITVAAIFAEIYVRGGLIVKGDAAATATNILAHESLFRLGFIADLIVVACDIAVALILYELLKPVSTSLSLFAAVFRLIHAGIMAVNLLNHFVPLVLLGGAHHFSVFNVDQLQSLALLFLSLHGHGYNICMVLFGFHCVVLGYLILKATFLPRIIGVLMVIAGVCYLTNSFATFLAPALARAFYPYILMPCGVAEWSLTLWLLVIGVNVPRWEEQASVAAQSRSPRDMRLEPIAN